MSSQDRVCEGCPYQRYPKIPAPFVPDRASLAIVGEAPGTTELAQKKPFVGASGQLVLKTMRGLRMPLKEGKDPVALNSFDVFLTNALLCRPPAGKPISKVAIERCRPRVLAELQRVKPKVIIATGNTALHCITGDHGLKITKEHGRALDSKNVPFSTIVACLHPSRILRTPGDFKLFVAAFKYAGQLLSGSERKHPGVTKFEALETEGDIREATFLLDECNRRDRFITADIETTGLDPRVSKVLTIGLAYGINRVLVVPERLVPATKPLFLEDWNWDWHNGKFDIGFLRRMGLPARVDHDTMLMHYCLNENPGTHDLEQLAAQELGAEPYKAKANKHDSVATKKGFAGLPLDILYERVATDADYQHQLGLRFLPQVEANPELKKLYYETLIPASAFLRRVERNGIYINLEVLNRLKKKLKDKTEDIREEIIDIAQDYWDPEQYMRQTGAKTADIIIKPSSPKQLAWLLYDKMRLRSKGKGRSTAEDAIEHLKDDVPLVGKLLEFRSVKKELSTYVEGIERRLSNDQRIHTTFLLHGTVTGRLSSRNPSIQNIKQESDIRLQFQPAPGKIFLEADYKGAELRVLAYLSGDKFLTRCFQEGRDLHDEVSIALFGHGFTRDDRMKAKTINFGIPYGRTAHSIAAAFGISVKEAQEMIDAWFANAKEAHQYLLSCDDAVRTGSVLTTPYGRHRRLGLVTGLTIDELQNEARNFRIQSISSDNTLHAGMLLEKPLLELQTTIENLVHDSILTECVDNPYSIEQSARKIVEVMMAVPKLKLGTDIPFEVDLKTGYDWMNLDKYELAS